VPHLFSICLVVVDRVCQLNKRLELPARHAALKVLYCVPQAALTEARKQASALRLAAAPRPAGGAADGVQPAAYALRGDAEAKEALLQRIALSRRRSWRL